MTVLATLILTEGTVSLDVVSKLAAVSFTLLVRPCKILNFFFIFSKHGLKSLMRAFQFYLLNRRIDARLATA